MAVLKVFVITGASRGLGLGLVTGLMKEQDNIVVAAARNPDKSDALQALVKKFPERLHTVAIDTMDEASVKAAAAHVDQILPEGVDYLINMAGVMDAKVIPALETEGSDYKRVLEVNTVGPFLVTQAFHPLLKKRDTRTVINVSSSLGSITYNRAGGTPLTGKIISYCSSKAALNMQTSVLAGALRDEKFTVVCTCPGWVDTDMGSRSDTKEVTGAAPELSVEQSTAKHLELIHRLTPEDNGKYYLAPKGTEIPY